MKSIFLILGGVFVAVFAFAQELPTVGEIPAIRNVSIIQDSGCGVPPPIGQVVTCPTVNRVKFEAQSIGPCDVFTLEIDPGTGTESGTGTETYLTIVKQTQPNCTRPQHEPAIEAKVLVLGDVLEGAVRLGNPILVETHFRQ